MNMKSDSLSRRKFLHLTALSLGTLGIGSGRAIDVSGGKGVSLIFDPEDPLLSTQPVTFAIRELQAAVFQAGVEFRQFPSLSDEAPRSDIYLVAAGKPTPRVSAWLKAAGSEFPTNPE